jgi:PadR family transcriptional regulator, regulatory protein PadR
MQSRVVDAVVTASEMAAKVERDFFGGSIRLHILYHAASGEVFGQGLMDELQHHGYRLSPGTLYPILHMLERSGYLQSTLKQVAGRRRRVYVATGAGRAALKASRQKVLELFQEILGSHNDAKKNKSACHRAAPGRSKRALLVPNPTAVQATTRRSTRHAKYETSK